MGVHGSPMGDPWVSYGLIWVFIRAHGPAWASMGCHGSNGYPMNLPWVSTHGFPWNSHKLYNGLLWNPIGLPRRTLVYMGHPWVTHMGYLGRPMGVHRSHMGAYGSPVSAHGSLVGSHWSLMEAQGRPWDSVGLPLTFHASTIIGFHGFPMGSHELPCHPTGLPWVSHGSPMGCPWVAHILPWPAHGLLWGPRGALMGLSWGSMGDPKECAKHPPRKMPTIMYITRICSLLHLLYIIMRSF